jgi:hypothetical protein
VISSLIKVQVCLSSKFFVFVVETDKGTYTFRENGGQERLPERTNRNALELKEGGKYCSEKAVGGI